MNILLEIGAFNAVGGLIFGTIILSVVIFIIFAFIREANDDTSGFNGIWIIVIAFIIMLSVLISKCSE